MYVRHLFSGWGGRIGPPRICSRDNATEALQAKVLTADEARRIASAIARLPELLGRSERDEHGDPER
jgi:hypothetical protein